MVIRLIIPFLIFCFILGCSYKDVIFTKEELKWTEPYQHDDTIVYKSPDNKRDTVIFYQVQRQINHTHSLEQGYYYTYSYSVDYRLTIESYHKIINPNEVGARTSLFDISKSTDDPTSAEQEFCFLGLIFDSKFLEDISNDTSSITLFDESKAQYKGVNINEGIRSFKFQKENGIISFIDKNNQEWFR